MAHLDEENAKRMTILSSLYQLIKYPFNLKRRTQFGFKETSEEHDQICDLKIEIHYKADYQ